MKNSIIKIFALITLTLNATYASQDCIKLYQTERVVEKAVANFMLTKLDASGDDITHISLSDQKDFISRKQLAAFILLSPVLAVADLVEGNDKHGVGFDITEVPSCLKNQNVKMKVKVEFHQENKLCSVNLRVKIKQDLIDPGYLSTVVKQKYAPICN